MKKISVILAAFCLFTNPIFSQNSFAPEIKRVAVFKNGYAFTFREGETKINDSGWVYTTNAPIGVLGTIWGYSTLPNVRVQQLLASQDETGATRQAANVAEFLLANEGKQIKVETQLGENPQFYMGIYHLLKPDAERIAYLSRQNPYEAGFALSNLTNLTIVLETETGTKVLPTQYLKTVEITGKANLMIAQKSNRLGFKVEGAKSGQNINLGVAALERGIRWIPAYRVEVKGSPIKEAKLELEANMINELADLKDTEINFVVGVPHFLFQDTMSPLSMNTAFAGVSSYFQTNRNSQNNYSNALMSQVADYSADGSSSESNPAPTVVDEEKLASFSAEQLFLYKADQISLKKGERASLRLFSLTVPCSEVFEWTLNDAPETEKRYLQYSNSSESKPFTEDLKGKIWYALRLKNDTKMPWTTAPALSFREWKPLGQDMLTFTPIGGENILRVTPATEVIGTHTLEEKSRERAQLNYAGSNYNFDLITVEGTIKLRNIKKEAVEVVLTRNLVGEVLSASDDGKISREGLNLQSVNPNSIVKWNLDIPNGEKEIRYTYKIYVRK